MQTPLVSVIVPVYNAGEYLDPCLESVAAQTLTDFEVILAECSPLAKDGELCDAWAEKDPRFQVLHLENQGALLNRGQGFAASHGRYIWFLDCDDLVHPQLLQTLVELLQTSELDCAGCRFVPFVSTPPAPQQICGEPRLLRAPTEHLDALLHDGAVAFSLCNKLYRRTLFEGIRFDLGVSQNEDLLLNWKLFQKANGLAMLDFVGYYYRQHESSSSHKPLTDRMIHDQLTVAQTILDDCEGKLLEESARAFIYEKELYLDSMILRRKNARDYRLRHRQLQKLLRRDFGAAIKNPQLAPAFKLTALLACWLSPCYRLFCRLLLTDRR